MIAWRWLGPLIILAVCLLQLPACSTHAGGYGPFASDVGEVLRVWKLNIVYDTTDGHWRIVAVASRPRHITRSMGSLDGTIFLIAAPSGAELDQGGYIYTRYAEVCGTVGLIGEWVRMSRVNPTYFVLGYDCGGTAGLQIRIFAHRWSGTDREEEHFFNEVFNGYSRLEPYVGDLDGDGVEEILVGTEASNDSGAIDAPRIYRVIKAQEIGGGEVRVLPVRTIGEAAVLDNKRLRILGEW